MGTFVSKIIIINMNSLLDELKSCLVDTLTGSQYDGDKVWSVYQKMADKVGLSEYGQRMTESSKWEGEYYREKQMDNRSYSPYSAPNTKYSDEQLTEFKQRIDRVQVAGEGVLFHVPHPYYRDLLRNYATGYGLQSWSYLDHNKEIERDNSLIYHYECKQTTPLDMFFWHDDWGTMGGYMGCYSTCPKCHERIHTDYIKGGSDFDPTDELAYKIVQGKNTLFIGTQQQVEQHKLDISKKGKDWNREQVRKRKELKALQST